jgi:hypothetical protein
MFLQKLSTIRFNTSSPQEACHGPRPKTKAVNSRVRLYLNNRKLELALTMSESCHKPTSRP